MLLTMLIFYGTQVVKTPASLFLPQTILKKFNQQKQNQKYREKKKKKKEENFVAYISLFFMLHFFIGVDEKKSHEGDGI